MRKIVGSNLEKTMLENLKYIASKFFRTHQQTDTHKGEVQSLEKQVQQIQSGNVPAGVKPFSIPESEKLDKQARNIECGRLVPEPKGKWRDMKKLYYKFKETSLAVDASVAHDQMKELEKTVDNESFMKECLACESVYKSKISTLEILDCRKACSIRWSKRH